jgi:integrase
MKHVRPYPVLCTGGTYAVRFSDRDGVVRNFSFGCRDKDDAARVARKLGLILDAAAMDEAMPKEAAEWLTKIPAAWRAKLVALRVVDGSRAASMDPLTAHFVAFANTFRRTKPRRADEVLTMLRKFATVADIARLPEITLRRTEKALDVMAETMSGPTLRKYQQCLKQFCGWAVRQELLVANPLAEMEGREGGTERERRALTPDEQRYLLAHVAGADDQVWHKQDATVRCLASGAERALIYGVALETGLRSGEMRSLTVDSFQLDQRVDGATVHLLKLKARDEKNRKGSTIKLRAATAALLRDYLAHKLPGSKAFPMPQSDETAGMLRRDMAAARAAWIKEGRTTAEQRERADSTFLADVDRDGAVVDFHALRVSFITNMARGGVPLQLAVKLARHSSAQLTVNIYTKAGVTDTEDALARLPDLYAPSLRLATGTHG